MARYRKLGVLNIQIPELIDPPVGGVFEASFDPSREADLVSHGAIEKLEEAPHVGEPEQPAAGGWAPIAQDVRDEGDAAEPAE